MAERECPLQPPLRGPTAHGRPWLTKASGTALAALQGSFVKGSGNHSLQVENVMQLSRDLSSISWCRCFISPYHTRSSISDYILQDRSHVLYPRVKRRYNDLLDRRQQWKREGLQIEVPANGMHKKWQRTVRSWAKRRVDQALTKQLREKGFDRQGRRLKKQWSPLERDGTHSAAQQSEHVNRLQIKDEDLCGSIRVQLLESVVVTKYSDIYQQAGLIIDDLVKRTGGRVVP